MSRAGFFKLMAFTLAVVIFVLVYRLIAVTPRNSESLHKLTKRNENATHGETSKTLPDALQSQIQHIAQDTLGSEQNQKDGQINSQIQQLLEELKPHKYSDDPYIEAYTLSQEVGFCKEQTSNQHQFFEDRFETLLAGLYERVKESCEAKIKRYPNLISLSSNYKTLQKISPTTAAGRSIKVMVPPKHAQPQQYRDLVNNRIKHVLQSNIGVLIAEAGMLSFVYFQKGETLPISQWLNSQDTEYNRQITQLALSKLSCRYQSGMACQATSSHMLLLCINEQTACGLDFHSYYEQNILPGMQKDVDILVEKFEAMAESD